MNDRLFRMASLEFVFLLYAVLTIFSTYYDVEASKKEETAELPKFLTELDLSVIEGSGENAEVLKKIVKRLAPEKNGEYQLYQGVTGQPGVDFPALTTIPATSFSCRGLKGGYYADLETNCQVFHICDNGRKISFLCPNGTIFQQSQLICDWWFKVDCSKSPELYEQSSEQLADEERKRAESRKLKLDLQRTSEKDNSHDYYDVQSLNYDGTQNGRISPYDESLKQNQLQSNRERIKQPQFDANNLFGQDANQRENSRGFGKNNYQTSSKPSHAGESVNKPRFNQYNNDYEDGGSPKYSTPSEDYYSTSKKAQNYHAINRNSNTQRDDKVALKRLKFKNVLRADSRNPTTQAPRNTPMYMEATTFRANNANPVKESQHFAESAAFVSNRGTRYNENNGNSSPFYYQLYTNRGTPENTNQESARSTSEEGQRDEISTTTRNEFQSATDSPPTSWYGKEVSTTTIPQETTLQYASTTVASPCDTDRFTVETITPMPPSFQEFQPVTESSAYFNTNNDYQGTFENTAGPRNTFSDASYYRNDGNTNDKITDEETIPPTNNPTTTRMYITTESYRQNTASQQGIDRENTRSKYTADTVTPSQSTFYDNTSTQNLESTDIQNSPDSRHEGPSIDPITTSKNPQTSQPYRQELTSTGTEKPFKSTNSYQQNDPTEKDISPYDTSFTYKQGKVMSTLGPYVPFTRNYAYTSTSTSTSTTTPKPTTYTPTVPTTVTTAAPTTIPPTIPPTVFPTTPNFYSSPATYSAAKSLIPKLKHGSVPTSNKYKANSQYLPEKEHALNMLQSLQGLEKKVPGLADSPKVTSRSRGNSPASGPSTLHSLALYFSTATENFDSQESTDSAVGTKLEEDRQSRTVQNGKKNTTVEVPTSILTQHTINSYAELFKLNNALETNNMTNEERFDPAIMYDEDYNEDLDIQQSAGPLNDQRNDTKISNSTKLRELAQVFTHALSAYLQDPGTFKKVLTEIRPTEPPETTTDSEQWQSTTMYPMSNEEYTLLINERDEVLDFSEDENELGRQKLTTPYPITTQPSTTAQASNSGDSNTRYTDYYMTPSTQPQNIYDSGTQEATVNSVSNTYYETTTQSTGVTHPYEEAQNFNEGNSNNINDRRNDVSEVNYFSYEDVSNQNRVGGFQNNSVPPSSPYGKIKLHVSAPGNDNYVSSSTPSNRPHYVHSAVYTWNRNPTSRKPEQQLTPPFHESYGRGGNRVATDDYSPEVFSTPIPIQKIRSTTSIPLRNSESSTKDQPHRIHFYKASHSGQRGNSESLATARSTYIKFRNHNRADAKTESTEKPVITTTLIPDTRTTDPVTMAATEIDTTPYVSTAYDDSSETNSQRNAVTVQYSKFLNNDHWTSSPAVTQLWETSVFVDPKRINHGLEFDSGTTMPTTTDAVVTERIERSTTPVSQEKTSTTDETVDLLTSNPDISAWQWLARDKDSPTAFTLLPTVFPIENTATPKPVITTRSSITTTITSSVTSTNAMPQENFVSSLLPFATTASKLNGTENEVAEKLFGKLNDTSTNTLIRVMKQADNNETVRQLVLLLINHCKEPTNKTTEKEKQQLINALLRMPVNEFSSDESRNVVAEINKLNVPTVRSRFAPSSNSTIRTRSTTTSSTHTEPPVTTFRSRKSRKFRTTTEDSANLIRRSDKVVMSDTYNSLSDEETSASDNRALELLRSLYTIATKWG